VSKTEADKAAMTITIDRELVEWVTEQAKVAGVSRNVLMAEIIGMHAGLSELGFCWVRDRRLGFNPLRKRPEDGYEAGISLIREEMPHRANASPKAVH
jgi:hypothetical protein